MTANEEKLYQIIRNYDRIWQNLILALERTDEEPSRFEIDPQRLAGLCGRIQGERTWTAKVRELIENPETAEEREESHEDQ